MHDTEFTRLRQEESKDFNEILIFRTYGVGVGPGVMVTIIRGPGAPAAGLVVGMAVPFRDTLLDSVEQIASPAWIIPAIFASLPY